jgi:quinol monooxygenase YgiN
MLPVLIAFAGVLIAAVATGTLAGRCVREPRLSLVVWTGAESGLMVALGAAGVGLATGFGSSSFRAVEVGGQLIAPVWLTWGLIEFTARRAVVRFSGRLIYGFALTVVCGPILATGPLSAVPFSKAWPVVGQHYQPVSHYALLAAQAAAIVGTLAAVGMAWARARSEPAWAPAMAGVGALGLAVLLTEALRASLPARSGYPLVAALAAGLIWFGVTRGLGTVDDSWRLAGRGDRSRRASRSRRDGRDSQDQQDQNSGSGRHTRGYEPDPYGQDPYRGDEYDRSTYRPQYGQDRYENGQYGPDSYAERSHGQGSYAPDPYAQDPYASDRYTPDPYAPDPRAAGSYAPDPYAADSYAPGAQRRGSHAADRYGSDQYGSDRQTPSQYGYDRNGSGRYPSGQYPSGRYASGQYQSGQYRSDRSAPERSTTDRYTSDRYPADQYGSDRRAPDPYGSGQGGNGRGAGYERDASYGQRSYGRDGRYETNGWDGRGDRSGSRSAGQGRLANPPVAPSVGVPLSASPPSSASAPAPAGGPLAASAPPSQQTSVAEEEYAAETTRGGSRSRPYGRIQIFTLLDDKAADFDRLAEQTAEEVRIGEPDTLVYVIHLVPNAPMQRIFYEIYRDRAAFDSHENKSYTKRFVAERRGYVLATNVIELRLKYAKVAPLPVDSRQLDAGPTARAQLPPAPTATPSNYPGRPDTGRPDTGRYDTPPQATGSGQWAQPPANPRYGRV